ncbi:MAG: hypothetical protein OXQ29_16880, partial [Rhodospirillaceae bacterium]|nr:hypothetical protein [Rhodospirillaceae bacterium]
MKALQTRRISSSLMALTLLLFLPSWSVAQQRQQLSTARLHVDWEKIRGHQSLPWRSLDDAQQAAVRRSNIPVLLPGSELVASAGLHITTGTDWYAASFKGDAHAVLVSGTTTVVLLDGHRPELPTLADAAPTPSRGEGIVEVDFEAFGAAYNLSVECYWPDDSRCAAD